MWLVDAVARWWWSIPPDHRVVRLRGRAHRGRAVGRRAHGPARAYGRLTAAALPAGAAAPGGVHLTRSPTTTALAEPERVGPPPLRCRLPRLQRSDPVGPHHLVVLVLDDVAVPDELAGSAELRPNPGHLAGIGGHGLLEAGLPRFARTRTSDEPSRRFGLSFGVDHQALTVDHLERRLVDVDGVGVGGEVVDLPDLGV